MRNRINLLAGVWAATCCATVQAQEGAGDLFDLSLEELMGMEVEIATGTKKSLSKAPAVVTMITSDDIEKTGATNVVDILESVPGVHVRFNKMSYSPMIHMRGVNTNQTLVMVNGSPLRDLREPYGIFWKGLSANAIDRIEVIRGPGSALYGSDANAGVINIVTKTAGTITESVSGVRVGSYGSKTVWVQDGGKVKDFDVGVTAEISQTDGHDPYIPVAKNSTSGTAKLGWHNADLRFYIAKDNWRVQADYARQHDQEIGFVGDNYLDTTTKASEERFNLAWLYNDEFYTEDWGLNAEARLQDYGFSSGDGFVEDPSTSPEKVQKMAADERRVSFEVSGIFSGVDNHEVRLGAGYNRSWIYDITHLINYKDTGWNDIGPLSTFTNLVGSDYQFVPLTPRSVRYAFLQDIWSIDENWELTAGGRYDYYSDFGGTFNPRLALVWNSTDQITTKFMYGESFRAPSYKELYDNSSWANPNPDLKPEKTNTVEVAISYAVNPNLSLGVNVFRYTIEDYITTGGDPRAYLNGDKFNISGVELEGQWQYSEAVRFSGNYTVRNPDESSLRKDYEPYDDAYLRSDWAFKPNWNWNVEANWTGDRKRTGNTLDGHWLFDTTIRHKQSDLWEFAGSIRNLFDKDAKESTSSSIANDLPLPERNLYLEARYNF